MRTKKTILLLLVFIMVFTLTACFNKAPKDDENDQVDQVDPVEETTNIKLYYVNKEYVETGDESKESLIVVEKDIDLKDKSVEEIILEELQKDPEDEKLTTMLGKLKVLNVMVEDNIAYVDFSSDSLSGGSLEESLILKQVVYSLTEVENIEAVQFLVDGDKQESLMGHIMIEEPLKREEM